MTVAGEAARQACDSLAWAETYTIKGIDNHTEGNAHAFNGVRRCVAQELQPGEAARTQDGGAVGPRERGAIRQRQAQRRQRPACIAQQRGQHQRRCRRLVGRVQAARRRWHPGHPAAGWGHRGDMGKSESSASRLAVRQWSMHCKSAVRGQAGVLSTMTMPLPHSEPPGTGTNMGHPKPA